MASTGHFPGAPINAQPLTTMATSSSGTSTSHSTASNVPLTAPPTSSTAESTSGAPPTSSAAQLPPPTSSAAAAAAKSKEIPTSSSSTTAPSSTTTTALTTTAATSTAAGANTTTTTVTGTRPTVRMGLPPYVILQNLFNECINRCNNCLFLLRKLRSKQESIMNMVLNKEINYRNPYAMLQAYKDLGTALQDVVNVFEKLAYVSGRLPRGIPPIHGVNMMRKLYLQEHTMNHTNIIHLLEKMIDTGNWNEGNYQVFYYLNELLRVLGKPKPEVEFEKQPLPELQFKTMATNGHSAFENAFKAMQREILNKSLGIYPRVLVNSATSLVVEFRFGSSVGGPGATAGKPFNERDIVFAMKFLLVEKNGQVHYINMIAPHEEWVKYNNFGRVVVNPFAPSRYEVYRRLTKQANAHLLNCFGSHANRWTANTMIQFVSLFGKFKDVFKTKCRSCQQVTKKFLPPLIFDIRTPHIAYHEGCR